MNNMVLIRFKWKSRIHEVDSKLEQVFEDGDDPEG